MAQRLIRLFYYFIAFSIVMNFISCSKQDRKAANERDSFIQEVEVVTVTRQTLPLVLEFPGRLQAVRTAEVRARVEGILEKRIFKEGEDVNVGEVLFRIDHRTLQANLDKAHADLLEAKSQSLFADQTAERYLVLIKEKAVSQQATDEAVARKDQAKATLLAKEAAATQAQIELNYATVTAPISGRIGRAFVTEGTLVRKSDATHLATIEQLDPIWANFTQTSSEFLRLQKAFKGGQLKAVNVPVELWLEDGVRYPQVGKLLFTERVIDSSTGSVAMRAEFPNPEKELLPGQFVKIKLTLGEFKDLLLIPQQAVLQNPEGMFVWRVNPENIVEASAIKTGDLIKDQWMVNEGLQEGDKIIVNNLQKLQPGMAVKPIPHSALRTPQ